MTTWVYSFAADVAPDRNLLGGKGANLADMTKAELPVPPGFTITTEACHAFNRTDSLPDDVWEQTVQALHKLEAYTEKQFGGPVNPLLVSVRSGAPVSMPGMMDTILNLGTNNITVMAMAARAGSGRFAYDSYGRFVQMFADVVLGIPSYLFEQEMEQVRRERKHRLEDDSLSVDDWQKTLARYFQLVEREAGNPFPQDPMVQLKMAVESVFRSWNNPRAVFYRKIHRISDDLGTAVNVQSMVFGNMGNDCGTGVAFSRNPSTGEPGVFGEYLANAQGEDVVAGTRTPQPIATLGQVMPRVYKEFTKLCTKLENRYRDVQDIEFTIESGRLYLLQTRSAKRTAEAAVRIAVDLVAEGQIDQATALHRVDPDVLDQLLHPRIDPAADVTVLATGLPASPGAVSGKITFRADDAERLASTGERVILVRNETTPEDIHGILAAEGILTTRGGMTSHAAVVARGMGKPCVCGCDALRIDAPSGTCVVGGMVLKEEDLLSIDGGSGRVMTGEVPRVQPELSPQLGVLLGWADERRRLGVRANADNPEDAAKARSFGAQGIGLCRTEHMFMAADRIPVVQQMILAESVEERRRALDKLLPIQQSDFAGILLAMDGLPVTIRLLDPPLHEFLPNLEQLVERKAILETEIRYEPTADREGELDSVRALLTKVKQLHEINPMLGHRGCRLGITFPEIYEMQVCAIFQAAADLQQQGHDPHPEVMIPLVGHREELRRMRELVVRVAAQVATQTGVTTPVIVGTMIEVPRAALTADEIAMEAEFFSFGTNDLTQTAFGFSRDDAEGKFLHHYTAERILPANPFAVFDAGGVGKLIRLAASGGRRVNQGLKLGICGEHGGEKASIRFFHDEGLNYVSCSPYRVPAARLAAAQAAVGSPRT